MVTIAEMSLSQFMEFSERCEQARLDAYLESEEHDEEEMEDNKEFEDDRDAPEPECNDDAFNGYDRICNGGK